MFFRQSPLFFYIYHDSWLGSILIGKFLFSGVTQLKLDGDFVVCVSDLTVSTIDKSLKRMSLAEKRKQGIWRYNRVPMPITIKPLKTI
jgi:hypothetical protein